MGGEASWSLSSAKPGHGVEQLRDGSTDTFWQSDGPQPHLINVQFQKKVRLSELRLCTNFKTDESYTPSCLSVRIGTSHHDLQEIQVVDLKEPGGWFTIPLAQPRNEARKVNAASTCTCTLRDPDAGGAIDFIRTHFVQLAIISNHQGGRDTHIRQIQAYAPRRSQQPTFGEGLSFQTTALQQFASIR